jgi:hypothetical protein
MTDIQLPEGLSDLEASDLRLGEFIQLAPHISGVEVTQGDPVLPLERAPHGPQ